MGGCCGSVVFGRRDEFSAEGIEDGVDLFEGVRWEEAFDFDLNFGFDVACRWVHSGSEAGGDAVFLVEFIEGPLDPRFESRVFRLHDAPCPEVGFVCIVKLVGLAESASSCSEGLLYFFSDD